MYFRMWNASQKCNPKRTSPQHSQQRMVISILISFNSPPGYENLLPRTRRRTRRPPILHTKTSTSKFRSWTQILKLDMIAQKDHLNGTKFFREVTSQRIEVKTIDQKDDLTFRTSWNILLLEMLTRTRMCRTQISLILVTFCSKSFVLIYHYITPI